jgi:phosphopentomutase
MRFERVFVMVLDSVGVGPLPDAPDYGDDDAATLPHIAEACSGLELPNLARWGLGNIATIAGTPPHPCPEAAFGKMAERSKGKDTMVGHWELAGLITSAALSTWPNGFTDEILEEIRDISARPVLGNCAASGTEIIEKLGAEHLRTGGLIVYTSADSVLQIAAHEKVVAPTELWDLCRELRPLADRHLIGRVIARPFVGAPGEFKRTHLRRDFPMPPPAKTVLDLCSEQGVEVVGVGKIHDIFAGRSIDRSVHTKSNTDGIAKTLELLSEPQHHSRLVFINLVDFDMLYGHRNDPAGYGRALQELDSAIPAIEAKMRDRDLVIVTADHGNDPTTTGTDHSREYVPVLARDSSARGSDLGTRSTFADVAATISRSFGLAPWPVGEPLI